MSIKVSVIIPVYNVEKYLEKCLDSVINQTLKDIEIICINDGSTDSSLEILEKYAEKDNRILLLNQHNLGLGASRNRGMEIAKGKYIAFLDSDDWIKNNAYELLYNSAEFYNSDLIIHKIMLYIQDENSFKTGNHYNINYLSSFFQKDSVFTHNDFKKEFFKIPKEVYSRFYQREFLEIVNAKFPEKLIFEDNPFFFEVMLNAKRIFLLDEYCVFRRVRKNSITSSKDNRFFDVIEIADMVIKVFKKNNLYEKYKREVINYKFYIIFKYVYKNISIEYKSDYFNIIKTTFQETRKDLVLHNDLKNLLDNHYLSFYLFVLEASSFEELDLMLKIYDLEKELKKKKKVIKKDKKKFSNKIEELKIKNKKLKNKNAKLKSKNIELKLKNNKHKSEIKKIHSSNIWKIAINMSKIWNKF